MSHHETHVTRAVTPSSAALRRTAVIISQKRRKKIQSNSTNRKNDKPKLHMRSSMAMEQS